MSDAINPSHYKHLPAEAIDIIMAAIDKAPSNQAALLHGQVLKYVLRCWDKNGIEDLRKAKWYLDRLINHCDLRESLLDISNGLVKAWVCENGKAKQVSPEQPQPPDGWRWLEVGEVIRKGDRYWFEDAWHDRHDDLVGCKYSVYHCRTIRRNRFEVGEKVVRVSEPRGIVFQVKCTFVDNFYGLETEGGLLDRLHGKDLAPYIEEQS